MIQPLDPYHGPIFTEPVDNKEESSLLDKIYHLIAGKREDYINPTNNSFIIWISIRSAKVSSKVAWDDWKQGDNELPAIRYSIVCCAHWIGTEVPEYPNLNGIWSLVYVINEIDLEIEETRKIPLLYVSLKETQDMLWGAHHNQIQRWEYVKYSLLIRFGGPREYSTGIIKYEGYTNPLKHIQNGRTKWTKQVLPEALWVHKLFLQAWYVREEMRRQKIAWQPKVAQFSKEFSFFDEDENIARTLK